jgi:hypothetical protein
VGQSPWLSQDGLTEPQQPGEQAGARPPKTVFPIRNDCQVILFFADFSANSLPSETEPSVKVRLRAAIQTIHIVFGCSAKKFSIHGVSLVDQQDL